MLQAFGVGVLEEEDEDIYGVEHLSNYDMTMDTEDHNNQFGWTAPRLNRTGHHFNHALWHLIISTSCSMAPEL